MATTYYGEHLSPHHLVFGIPDEPIERLVGVPAGATVEVLQWPDEWAQAIVTTANKKSLWYIETTAVPGTYRLGILSHVEYMDRGVPSYIVEMMGTALYYVLWPVWFVIDIIVRDYRAHRDMLDSKCPD